MGKKPPPLHLTLNLKYPLLNVKSNFLKMNNQKSTNVINKLLLSFQNMKPQLKLMNVNVKFSKLNHLLLKKNSNLWLANLKKPQVLLKVPTENTKKLLVNSKLSKVI